MSVLAWIAVGFAIVFVASVLLGWALMKMAAPHSAEERRQEDRAQVAYLKEWSRQHPRG